MRGKKLTILCDGGKEVGFGHITRCLSISYAFEQNGFTSEFIVNGDDSISSLLTTYTLLEWQNEPQLALKLSQSSLLLIDSMFASKEKLLELENTNIPLIFIDDEKQMNVLNRGFVIDWTVMSEKRWKLLEQKKDVVYLLGSSYTPLRKEFAEAKKTVIKEKLENILVTFGGSDVRNLTPKILQELTKNFPHLRKDVIIGPGYDNIESIEALKDDNTNLLLHVDAKKMIELMQNADIAIASGGQTLYELSFIGTPTIAILVVENAKDDTQGWDEIGSVKSLGWYENPHLLEELSDTIRFLQDKDVRLKMQESAKGALRNDGASYLVQTILQHLKRSE